MWSKININQERETEHHSLTSLLLISADYFTHWPCSFLIVYMNILYGYPVKRRSTFFFVVGIYIYLLFIAYCFNNLIVVLRGNLSLYSVEHTLVISSSL